MSIVDGAIAPSRQPAVLGEPSLKARLRRAERLRKWQAFGLVAPLLIFILVTFVLPIGDMMWRSVDDRELAQIMPRTIAAVAEWDGKDLPGDEAFRALVTDIAAAKEAGTLNVVARRLNYDINGYRTLVMSTARRLPDAAAPDLREQMLAINPSWGEVEHWGAIKRAAGPLTSFYLLAAVDLQRTAAGDIVQTPEDRSIYRDVLMRTFAISLTVTLLCLALAFPVAYLLATQPPKIANPLMILVLLPFWTSLLVRTAAWVVLLQKDGLVNNLLLWLGIIDEPLRLIYNSVGVYVAMTHVLLPFMILPLYSTMKSISPAYMRAATSLGAPPTIAFLRVYMPQCLPGMAAGGLMVFILATGYYITPALVGGPGDQMLSYFIAFYTTDTVNWGMASALGAVLLASTLLLYGVYNRLTGGGQVKMG